MVLLILMRGNPKGKISNKRNGGVNTADESARIRKTDRQEKGTTKRSRPPRYEREVKSREKKSQGTNRQEVVKQG